MIEAVLVPICFLIDQWTKRKAVSELIPQDKKTILKGNVNLHVIYNRGAFLGILGNHKKILMGVNILSLLMLSVIMIGLFFIKGFHLIKIGISFMVGGALGNIYDRIKRKKVTDFFSFRIKPKVYFNLADIFIFIGAFLILINSLLFWFKKGNY